MNKYDIAGRQVIVVESLKDDRYLVRRVYEEKTPEGIEEYFGDLEIIGAVFASPPLPKLCEKAKKLNADVKQSQELLKRLNNEVSEQKALLGKLQDQYEEANKFGDLSLFVDLATGKDVWYLTKGSWEVKHYGEPIDEYNYRSKHAVGYIYDWDKRDMRLVISCYSSLNDRHINDVNFFRTKEEAEAQARLNALNKANQMVKDCYRFHPCGSLAEFVIEKGWDDSDDFKEFISFYRNGIIAGMRQRIAETEKDLEKKKKELEEF